MGWCGGEPTGPARSDGAHMKLRTIFTPPTPRTGSGRSLAHSRPRTMVCRDKLGKSGERCGRHLERNSQRGIRFHCIPSESWLTNPRSAWVASAGTTNIW
jgi:hypothetical protein